MFFTYRCTLKGETSQPQIKSRHEFETVNKYLAVTYLQLSSSQYAKEITATSTEGFPVSLLTGKDVDDGTDDDFEVVLG